MSLLPITNNVLKVFQLSSNFSRAVKLVSETIEHVCANEIVVRNEYVGVNATDLNVTAGRYFAHQPLPYPLGIEVSTASEKVCPLTDSPPSEHFNTIDLIKCSHFIAFPF